jgi:hypothetical protein
VSADRQIAPSLPVELAIVGAGPTGTSFLERLTANLPCVAPGLPVRIHLVDPFPAGQGRIWRHEQTPLLWMNSMAEDVTMFTDDSVVCEGPIRPGPTLLEWAESRRGSPLATPELTAELAALEGPTFPSRRIQSAYLAAVLERVLGDLPPGTEVRTHRAAAIALDHTADGRQRLTLDDGTALAVDVVVLALGHADTDGFDDELAGFADRHRLVHVPPALTADIDLDVVPGGEPVILRGLGLAFIDIVVMLTEGRGGRFEPSGDGALRYIPSGREPILHIGSRRGVPYHSKTTYRLVGGAPLLPRFFDAAAVDDLLERHDRLDFRAHVWPLLAKEICWGYYQELFRGHPDRVTMPFAEFAERYAVVDHASPDMEALIESAVPVLEDHIDLAAIDRPLAGLRFDDASAVHEHVRRYIAADVARRSDRRYSADLGAFMALLSSFGQLPRLIASGKLDVRSRVEHLDGWWFGFFNFIASGPPPARLRQILALADAGIVRFQGAGQWVRADEHAGRFVAGSTSCDDVVHARALVEARNQRPSIARTANPLVRHLRDRGGIVEDVLADPTSGFRHATGKISVTSDALRLVDARGDAHPRRFALGAPTNRPAAGAFARPRTNAPSFRQNDAVARAVIGELCDASEASKRSRAAS